MAIQISLYILNNEALYLQLHSDIIPTTPKEDKRPGYNLCIKQFLVCTAITLPRNKQGIEDLLKLSHILVSQRRSLAVLDNALNLGGAGDRNRAPVTHPPNSHLRRRHALPLGDLLHRLHELEILLEDVGLEARQYAVEVAMRDVIGLANLARQPTAADGAVCHDGNANCV